MPFQFPREVLLIEIDRYCSFDDCGARNRVSLTKAEAIEYGGFDCFKCERWNDDVLRPDAVPESWTEAVAVNDEELAN